ncbi:MAG: helix-turn-helix domain-containing protein, partial [Candidatus Nanopelagicales bacterium]
MGYFSDALDVECRRAGLSLVALADRAGVARATVTAARARRTVPSTTTIMRLAAALGCDPVSLSAAAIADAS